MAPSAFSQFRNVNRVDSGQDLHRKADAHDRTDRLRQYGVVTASQRLVTRLADGADLNEVWSLFSELMAFWNTERTSITDLLTFKTVNPVDAVPANLSVSSFSEASEFGIPRAANLPGDSLPMGYRFRDLDSRSSFTWQALRALDLVPSKL